MVELQQQRLGEWAIERMNVRQSEWLGTPVSQPDTTHVANLDTRNEDQYLSGSATEADQSWPKRTTDLRWWRRQAKGNGTEGVLRRADNSLEICQNGNQQKVPRTVDTWQPGYISCGDNLAYFPHWRTHKCPACIRPAHNCDSVRSADGQLQYQKISDFTAALYIDKQFKCFTRKKDFNFYNFLIWFYLYPNYKSLIIDFSDTVI